MLPGIIGSLQTNEAIKLAAGIGEPLIGRLLLFDALSTEFSDVKIERRADDRRRQHRRRRHLGEREGRGGVPVDEHVDGETM